MVQFKVDPFVEKSYISSGEYIIVSPFDVATMMRECAGQWDLLGTHKKRRLRESTEDIIINALEELAEIEEKCEDVSVHD